MAKKTKTEEPVAFNFQNFLSLLSVDDLIENVKIEPDSKGRLFSQVVDPDQTTMGEITFTEEQVGKMLAEPICIFNLRKLIDMVSYVDDVGEGKAKLKIKQNVLSYGKGPKNVIYRLGDSSVMKDLDIGRTISEFLEEQEFKFKLKNNEIRELLRALNIAERDGQLEILVKDGKVMLVVGKIDKVFLKPTTEVEQIKGKTTDSKITLQTRIMVRVLKTILQVPGSEAIIYCKPEYPAVMQLSSPLNKTLAAAFLIAPLIENDLD
jgi:hypothetical protein